MARPAKRKPELVIVIGKTPPIKPEPGKKPPMKPEPGKKKKGGPKC